MKHHAKSGRTIDAPRLKAMLAAAAEWLELNAAGINAINVFPVPDGDTGSNMSATLRAAVEAARAADGGAGAVLAAAAHGALLEARGNSGVILSQILAGLAEDVEQADKVDGAVLAKGLERADAVARQAVTEPREGTILTVLRDAASAASAAAAGGTDVAGVMVAAAAAAAASVARTPELLPILKQAGVVDAGGLGLSVVLDGCVSELTGRERPEPVLSESQSSGHIHAMENAYDETGPGLGYCTEFMLGGDSLQPASIRQQLCELGDSVLVVGQAGLLRVHIHTADPGAALSLGVRCGVLSRIKIDNIDAQHTAMVEASTPAQAVTISVVAVAVGEGFEALFAGYGATVVPGGRTLNPSTQEILEGIERAPGSSVAVLPNNRNAVPSANQAARLASKEARVIPTESMPQGLAGLLALNPDRSLSDNVRSMREAAASVQTVAVTRAARAVTIDGVAAAKGQPIAVIDDRLAASAETPEEAALAALAQIPTDVEILTLYYGHDVPRDRAQACAGLIHDRIATAEIEVVAGGQPNYDYIISVE